MRKLALINFEHVLKSINSSQKWMSRCCHIKSQIYKPIEFLKTNQLWKPFGFSVGVTLISFSAATIIECERLASTLEIQKDWVKKWIWEQKQKQKQKQMKKEKQPVRC